jgi:HPt (histidine-containing phosphotransfer) domain-containing protein
MQPSDQPGEPADPNLSQALEQLWGRFLPEMRERVAVLSLAATAVAQQKLTAAGREAAHSAAHKLAGVLGTFGLKHGTDLARNLERLFSTESGADLSDSRPLITSVQELREMIENRKSAV